MRNINRLLAAIALCMLLAAPAAASDQNKIDTAIKAAEAWLTLVDAGDYETSWEQASTFFKNAVSKQEWVDALHSIRDQLGDIKGRRMLASQYITEMTGAPDGHYVTVHYTSSFANKADAQEVVTPMLDEDGAWRVSGYYIR